jgi:LysM repeat protein
VNQSICLPPTCTTYTVQSGDTCESIANATTTTFQQLVAWNPFLDSYCTNLLAGQNICASPPGGAPTLTTIVGATVTQTAIYATATVSRPSSVAPGTTIDCGRYYDVQLVSNISTQLLIIYYVFERALTSHIQGDTCQLIALNSTISLGLFYSINPSLNSDCTNLELGVNYCVFPTADWNSTASSTIVTAPTTTPSGTTGNCYQYYIIQSGDYCGKVEDTFAITMGQLQEWNPSLLSDCSNLELGEAYCVNGVTADTSSPTSTAAVKMVRGVNGHGHHGYPRRHVVPEEEPQKTPPPQVGGVPMGWPGLGAARLNKGAGYGHKEL